MEVVSAKNGTTRKFRYGCSAYHRKGRAICGNSLVMDVQRIDLAMVDALESMLLREAVLEMQSSKQSVRSGGTPRRTTSSDLRAESPPLIRRYLDSWNSLLKGKALRLLAKRFASGMRSELACRSDFGSSKNRLLIARDFEAN